MRVNDDVSIMVSSDMEQRFSIVKNLDLRHVAVHNQREVRPCQRLNQHLTRLPHELVNLFFNLWVDHNIGPFSSRTGKARRGAKQPTNQRPFSINFTSILTQMRATQIGQRRLMFHFALHRKRCHLYGRCSHRSAAIMTPRLTLEAGDVVSKETDFLAITCHCGQFRKWQTRV